MGEDGARLVRLGTTHHNAVRTPLYHVQIEIGVGLLAGAQASIPFYVGHGAVADEVVVLHVTQVVQEARVVVCAQRLIHLVGRAVKGVQRVPTHTTLEACARLLSQTPQGFDFVEQVLIAAVQASKAVDGLPVHSLPHEPLADARVLCHGVGLGQRIQREAQHGMRGAVSDALAQDV